MGLNGLNKVVSEEYELRMARGKMGGATTLRAHVV